MLTLSEYYADAHWPPLSVGGIGPVAIDVESPWLRVRIHSASPGRDINAARRPQNDAGDRTGLSYVRSLWNILPAT